jgi:Nucleotidyltransferase of unknown function (DUF6036)
LPTRQNKALPEPWLSFLRELDSAVDEDLRLDCMGGFVISMVYGFSRPTADLDVLEIAPREAGRPMLELGRQGGLLHKKHKVYLDHVGVAHVPDNYEERLPEIFPNVFQHLHLFALDPYDLALSKLERNIQRDRDDVKHLARTIPLDLEVLKVRYQKELRWQLGNPEREDLTLRLWVEAIQEEQSQ